MMTSFSIGGLSGEVSKETPLENGYVPGCKPRKISAIRDFPPGCGFNVLVTDFKPEENVGCEVGMLESANVNNDEMDDVPLADGVKPLGTNDVLEVSGAENFEMVNCLEADSVGIDDQPKFVKLDESKNDEIVTDEKPSGVINSYIEVDCWSHCINSPSDIEVAESIGASEENVMMVATDGFSSIEESVMEVRPPGVEFPNKVECQTLEELDQPTLSGRAKALDSLVEEVEKTMDCFSNCDEDLIPEFDSSEKKTASIGQPILKELNEKEAMALFPNSDVEEAKPELDAGSSVDQQSLLGSSHSSSSYHCSFRVGTSAMLKDKCRPRRISAVRDFPPHCGTQNLLPTEEKLQMIISEMDYQDGVEKAKVELEASKYLDDGSPGATLMGISRTIAFRENNIEELDAGRAEFGLGPMFKAMQDDRHEKNRKPVDKETAEHVLVAEPSPVAICAVPSNSDWNTAGPVGKEIILYSPDRSDKMRTSRSVSSMEDEVEREIVHGLVAAPYCPWRNGKFILQNSDGGISGGKVRKHNLSVRKKAQAVSKKSSSKMILLEEQSGKQKKVPVVNDADGSPRAFMPKDEEGHSHGDLTSKSITRPKRQNIDANLLPFGPNNSSQGDARNRVRETLRLFHTICRKLLQKEEANLIPDEEGNLRESDKKLKRIDLRSAKIIKDKGKEVNTDKRILGQVPGVEVGDEFQYRVELAIVGIHRLYQAGIDSLKVDGTPVATSVVASGAYSDDLDNADVLIYSGQGGNVVGKVKKPEDQKLERGNLALRNSITSGTPVRVVRGWKEMKSVDPAESRPKTVTIYVYDGLYTVKNYWTETGPHGKLVFMFELRRNPGQPELAWKELKSSNKSKIRPGICVSDISEGKESIPICAVNTIDDEKPPPFNYTRKMIYPNWYCPVPPEGCNCTGRCGDSKKCPCAVRNGGEIPYNRNGAIVEAKPLVFECGPSCKCPPSCYNRVAQRGIKFKLEIFKTESRGWGIRSLNSIPSGCFICEYAGELLEDKEAEQRIGNDEYLFDIGHNYSDFSLKPEGQEILVESVEEAEAGYTIDAGQYGNVGRFVNHSCSPNLYAQNVIYDNDDKRMPHVMLFAAENIPPLQELTYHYNYSVDQIRDSNGNIKIKKCLCGSAECTGRMY